MRYDISKIEKLYPNWYDKNSPLSYGDQKWIWEHVPLPEEEEVKLRYLEANGNASVKWNVNDSYKRTVNFELTENKLNVIAELGTLNYRTTPIKISQLLQTLFAEYNSWNGHWLYVAQHWNPRAINRVINYMVKVHENGTRSIQNSAAYFTYLIQKRKRRRSL